MTTPQEPLKTRVQALEAEVITLRQHLKDAAERLGEVLHTVGELSAEVRRLRQRMAQFWPDKYYCPKCRALVHQAATNCRACGASWGDKPDPKAGLPR